MRPKPQLTKAEIGYAVDATFEAIEHVKAVLAAKQRLIREGKHALHIKSWELCLRNFRALRKKLVAIKRAS